MNTARPKSSERISHFLTLAEYVRKRAEDPNTKALGTPLDALRYQGKSQILDILNTTPKDQDPLGIAETMNAVIDTLPPANMQSVCAVITANPSDIGAHAYAELMDNAIRGICMSYSRVTGDTISDQLFMSEVNRSDLYQNTLGAVIATEFTDTVKERHTHHIYINEKATADPWTVLTAVFEALGARLAEQKLSHNNNSELQETQDLFELYQAIGPYTWGMLPKGEFSREPDDYHLYRQHPCIKAAGKAVEAMEEKGFQEPDTGRSHKPPFTYASIIGSDTSPAHIRYIENCIINQLADPVLKQSGKMDEAAMEMTEALSVFQLREMDIRVKALLCGALLQKKNPQTGHMDGHYKRMGQKIIQNSAMPAAAEARLKQTNGAFIRQYVAHDSFDDMVCNWNAHKNGQIDSFLQDFSDQYCAFANMPRIPIMVYSDEDDGKKGYHMYLQDEDQHIVGLNAAKMDNFFDMYETFEVLAHELCAHGRLSHFVNDCQKTGAHGNLTVDEHRAEELMVLLNRIFYTSPEQGHELYEGQLEEKTANNTGAFMADQLWSYASRHIERLRAQLGYFPENYDRFTERPHKSEEKALGQLADRLNAERRLTQTAQSVPNSTHGKHRPR